MPDGLVVMAAVGGLFGLLVGSFLNVVIHRLPQMMERQWAAECAELNGQPAAPQAPFNLLVPRSRCGHCGHPIRWYENIPVLSYLALRGKCSACGTPIGLRYPLVELATGLLFGWCVWRWGWSWTAAAWCLFAAMLVALTLIDWDTTLLPDDLTLPLLWLGLIAATLGLTGVRLSDAVWGAVAGYLSLWLVYWGFKLATGKEGMGFGDFKLFAALGAWFGWQALVPIILMASVIGALVGIGMKLLSALREGGVVPFGPFLALGGITAMVLGPQTILRAVGL
ncbi:MAG: prepilin peptidase [Rubrivivax sp.]|uniref:prepilin peptidase n=1 Tax=Ottowia sp. TaxID=1898956 RepID=UPI002176FFD4|nr:prepilin peptidase [Ottowia sp.]MCC6814032.1 prepilin peptidase [Rubrivivax sp.]HNR84485.1 prepilin peptidase [Ottowia sp.]HOZ93242.1 prepilin peptidase [Ottowia sp.]HQO53518.1 prepilin peptidase [Ottowia sp.]